MARKTEVSGERIIDAVMEIVEESGFGEVSARNVAARLGISTQPIYRIFGDMDGVRQAAIERGWRTVAREVSGEALDRAVGYVKFAVKHKRLFEFLFREQNYGYDGLNDLSHKLVDGTIIDKLVEITGLSRETAYRVHLCIWMALHGLAAVAADNEMTLSEREIEQFTKDISRAMTAFYKSDGENV